MYTLSYLYKHAQQKQPVSCINTKIDLHTKLIKHSQINSKNQGCRSCFWYGGVIRLCVNTKCLLARTEVCLRNCEVGKIALIFSKQELCSLVNTFRCKSRKVDDKKTHLHEPDRPKFCVEGIFVHILVKLVTF